MRPVAANVAAMLPTHDGSFRFFRFAGIQVYVHWSWFIVAVYKVEKLSRTRGYSELLWSVAEYFALFLIVLLHEFGHAFACRQTGGKADQIILWPLGGVAFVQPPPRPGAELWSIAAGPLVNVVLVPVLWVFAYIADAQGWTIANPDLSLFLAAVFWMNLGLLLFNLLPVYPLDGGQILRALLWFRFGRARSLQVSVIIGFVGVAGLVGLAILSKSLWIGLAAIFTGYLCVKGYRQAQGLFALAKLPRHTGVACPECRERPPGGPLWSCGQCGNRFDPFSTRAVCPHCGTVRPAVPCVHCGTASPIERWETVPRAGRGTPPVIDV